MCREARESKPVVSRFKCTSLLESVKGSANQARLDAADVKQRWGAGPALRMFTMTSWMRKAGLVLSALEIKTQGLDLHFPSKPSRSYPVLRFFNLQNEAAACLLKWQSAAFFAWPVTPNEYPASGLSSSKCFRASRALHNISLMGWSSSFPVICGIHQKCTSTLPWLWLLLHFCDRVELLRRRRDQEQMTMRKFQCISSAPDQLRLVLAEKRRLVGRQREELPPSPAARLGQAWGGDSHPLSIISIMLKYLLAFGSNSSFPVSLVRD